MMEKGEDQLKTVLLGPIFFDIFASLLIALVFILIPEVGLEPYRRGFFCDDQSIRLPFKGDTVTPVLLAVILFVMLFGTIGGVEFYRSRWLESFDGDSYIVRGHQVHRLVARFSIYAAYCLFGELVDFIFCEVTKYSVGRLRPHFIDVCRPNVGMTSCNDSLLYITEYTCTASPSAYGKVKDSRLSFFSGHSSMSMHIAVYCVIYMYARLPRRVYGISLLPILQTLHVIVALLIGYSRISDHKHHFSDVAVGFIVGAFTGSVSAIYLARLLERMPSKFQGEHCALLTDVGNRSECQDTVDRRNVQQSQNLSLESVEAGLPMVAAGAANELNNVTIK